MNDAACIQNKNFEFVLYKFVHENNPLSLKNAKYKKFFFAVTFLFNFQIGPIVSTNLKFSSKSLKRFFDDMA